MLGGAINYCLNRWTKLITFLEDGNLDIDNNLALPTGIYNPQDSQKTFSLTGFSA